MVTSGDGSTAKVSARQVAPGRYEARVTADARQRLTIRVADANFTAPARMVLPDPNAEYRFHPADEALLRSIAEATGGAFKPTPEVLRQTSGSHQTARRALWPTLVAIALGLWLVDVLLRRVRVFEESVPV